MAHATNILSQATSATLVRTDHLELFRLVLPAGKKLPQHQVASVITVQCIEGAVTIRAANLDRDQMHRPRCRSDARERRFAIHLTRVKLFDFGLLDDAAVTMPERFATELPPLRIKRRTLLPIVQGGMGVGVSAHRLAGAVARLNAVGTISSVDLRRHHPDLMVATEKGRDKQAIERANLVALDREIRAALALAEGHGMIAVNVMRAVSQYADYVRQSCESGAHALVVGAGLPLDLPELAAPYPDVALIPILSEARGIGIVLKKWLRKNRLPDAIVIEHPKHAGGHLGAAKLEELGDERFEFPRVMEETFNLFRELGIERERIPLIPAGGIASPEQVRELIALGAAAIQIGTPFAVTEEGDAHPNFKRVLVEAKPEDIVEFMSVAGLPARAVRTPWLERYLAKLPVLQARAHKRKQCTLGWDCLEACGLRDGNAKMGQFCIDLHLALAVGGDIERGLFFRGAGPLPFGTEIRPVRDLIGFLLGPR